MCKSDRHFSALAIRTVEVILSMTDLGPGIDRAVRLDKSRGVSLGYREERAQWRDVCVSSDLGGV